MTSSNIPTLRLIDQPDGIDSTITAIPAPPEGLGEAGTDLWIDVNTTFNFHDEPGKLAILEQACRTVDTIAQLEEAQRGASLTTKGSMGQSVISPFIQEARQQRNALNSLMKSLGLPDSDEEAVAKAQRRTTQARNAANARHNPGGVK